MASEVGICNSALIKLGASTIIALTDGSKNANLCNAQYAELRDELLRTHVWNFAKSRQKLGKLAAAPVYEFDNAFQLPADWLRTISVHDNDAGFGTVTYRIEGRTVLAGADELWLTYIRRATDPNEMTATFREALSWRLALDLSQAITQSSTVMERMRQGFIPALSVASAVDGVEDFPETMPTGSWVSERN